MSNRADKIPGSHIYFGNRAALWSALSARKSVLQILTLILLVGALAPRAEALVRFDFEQKYYTHPGRQVWDFSMIRPDSIYHIFYHTINEATPNAVFADTIWQATSPDLKHWSEPVPILEVGQGPWDAGAIWAPAIVRDDERNRWALAYTGCDAAMNQTICLAFSYNLKYWTKATSNPTAVADTSLYNWDPAGNWSNFRDPFIYRQDQLWHMLVTAQQTIGGLNRGVVYHATSNNLATWTDVGPLFVNDGATPSRVLESCQYKVIGSTHHLLFSEFDDYGTTVLSASDPGNWTMADRVLLDWGGYAPELNEFDPGKYIFSRLTPYLQPNGVDLSYVVRMDTLLTDAQGDNPLVFKPHPLNDNWVVHSGTANLASPTFGDNPVWRGEPSVGVVGNSYYSSKEYFQGPLSGRGAPGIQLSDTITGLCESYRFPVTGDRMTLLVGGGYFPNSCYVALVDDQTDEVLLSETGTGDELMTQREWNLQPYQGRLCYIAIVDQETQAGGHISLDEIVEISDFAAADVATLPASLARHGVWPNPFNPRTTVSFELAQPATCEVQVLDLRGRLIWRSGSFQGHPGTNRAVWHGRDMSGAPAGTGTYLYAIAVDGTIRASAKMSLVK